MYCSNCKSETDGDWPYVGDPSEDPIVRCPNCDEFAYWAADLHELEARFTPHFAGRTIEAIFIGPFEHAEFRRARLMEGATFWRVYVSHDGKSVRAFKDDSERFGVVKVRLYPEKHAPTASIKTPRYDKNAKQIYDHYYDYKLVDCAWHFDVGGELIEHLSDDTSNSHFSNLKRGTYSSNMKRFHQNRDVAINENKYRQFPIKTKWLDMLRRKHGGAKESELVTIVENIIRLHISESERS
jgi:hypothetical protein